ncbi:MAG: peroxide stress protein YaaA [Bacteroidota bacterium]|nr:peroxide stress protein YaaA [Bacteroidota bacterium]
MDQSITPMLTILGPAKTIDMSPHGVTEHHSTPLYLDQAEELVDQLRGYSLSQLKSLMKVSDNLTTLTFERYASWHKFYAVDKGQQAILAFSGEVFNGLKARTLSEKDLLFAQEHIRILSGLYGVLRPLDLILPYRLEMGAKMKNRGGRNLYDFWKAIIPEKIEADTGQQDTRVLINLASNEYFKSIQPGTFPHEIITPVFKESHGAGFRNVTIYAKKARGMMLRFIIQNRINNPEYLKAFDEEGYYFNTNLSTEKEWIFCR